MKLSQVETKWRRNEPANQLYNLEVHIWPRPSKDHGHDSLGEESNMSVAPSSYHHRSFFYMHQPAFGWQKG